MTSTPSSAGYWCHRCNRLIRLTSRGAPLVCPLCNGEFVEEVEEGPRSQLLEALSFEGDVERRPNTVQLIEATSNLLNQFNDHRRDEDGGFRPVTLVRGGHRGRDDNGGNGGGMGFILSIGSGIRGLTQNDRCGPPPAPTSAVDAMPTVRVTRDHIRSNPNCPVCTDPFELGSNVREMPCKHIFHSECIVPWLTQHSSCPVCHQTLPTEDGADNRQQQAADNGQQQPRSTTRGAAPVEATTLAIATTRQGGRATNTNNNSNFNPTRDNSAHQGSTGHNQGRRSFFNLNWWPFRLSNSNPQGTYIRASNSSDGVNWMRSGWPFDDGNDPFRWFN